MPNLRGASPIGRGGEDRSYEARTVGSGRSGGRRHDIGGRGGLMFGWTSSRTRHGREESENTSERRPEGGRRVCLGMETTRWTVVQQRRLECPWQAWRVTAIPEESQRVATSSGGGQS